MLKILINNLKILKAQIDYKISQRNNQLRFYDLLYSNKQKKILEPFNVMGVYGIFVNNEIIYIGSSKNIGERIITHKHHILKPIEKCLKCKKDFLPIYIKLRELYNKDKDFYFGIIEKVNDEYQLRLKERQYIKTLNPKYNVKKY